MWEVRHRRRPWDRAEGHARKKEKEERKKTMTHEPDKIHAKRKRQKTQKRYVYVVGEKTQQ